MISIKKMGFLKEAESLTKKREEAIKFLGNKWILAKSNFVQKKEVK